MKMIKGISTPILVLMLSLNAYGQTEVHSGILHTQSDVEESNLIKLHCDALSDAHTQSLIRSEYDKYAGQIVSTDFDLVNKKIYVKYYSTMSPNMLLGILERVVVKAYYMDNGTPVYYSKTGTESYKR